MVDAKTLYQQLKDYLDFGPDDVKTLQEIAPWVHKNGPKITDVFYESILKTENLAAMVKGRVEELKKTHIKWMLELVGGDYGDAYFDSRWRIGLAHVRIGLNPVWVDGTMSLIRGEVLVGLAQSDEDKDKLARAQASLLKICDLDLAIINLAYSEDRLSRLTEFTGLKRGLIENIITLPQK